MIQANGLRIGNLVNHISFGVVEIKGVLEDSLKTFYKDNEYWDDNKFHKPITISEKHLNEFHFEEAREGSGEYFLDDNSIFRHVIRIKKHPTKSGFLVVARDFILCTLIYVHDLQNLYFSLTAKELKRKENK